MNKIKNMQIVVLVFASIITYSLAVCPAANVAVPCICSGNTTISNLVCNTTVSYDIKKIFTKIEETDDPDDPHLHFDSVLVHNYEGTNLPENVFSDILVKSIEFSGGNISSINPNAFTTTNLRAESLSIRETLLDNKGNKEKQLFECVSKLTHLKYLYVIDNQLSSIPERAFKNIIGSQRSLKTVDLSGNKIGNIGENAFYDLPSLTKLVLSNNRIVNIDLQTFGFHAQSVNTLEIDLRSNQLDSTSFDRNWYIRALRPIKLNLANNKLTFLPERVFSIFLNREKNNTINLSMNPIICDCKAKWLVEDPNFYKSKVEGMLCKDEGNKNIFDFNVNDQKFSSCVDKSDTLFKFA